jgi:branched-chain amino acid transport system ATP-binding protein
MSAVNGTEQPERAEQPGQPVLELRDVTAAYGPVRALFGVSLGVGRGEALALIGPNGAGKTTVARVASGLVAPTLGAVVVDGADVTGSRPYQFARAGVAHAPEGRSVFATLTVEENLVLSFRRARGRNGVRSGLDLAFEMFPALEVRRRQVAGTLSGGEQRMLSMARVLVEVPKLLVADELSLGLAPIVVEQLYESLQRLRGTGTALLVVEQHVKHALELCDRVAVLDHGTVSWAGPSAEAGEHVHTHLAGVP